jgi:hypothetical protein
VVITGDSLGILAEHDQGIATVEHRLGCISACKCRRRLLELSSAIQGDSLPPRITEAPGRFGIPSLAHAVSPLLIWGEPEVGKRLAG